MHIINHFDSEEYKEPHRRESKYLPTKRGKGHRPFNSKYFDKNTDMEITDPWKAAIRMCTLRTMNIPTEIIFDFMVVNGLWEEE